MVEEDKGYIPHTIAVQRKRESALEPHSRAAHPVRDGVKIQTQHRWEEGWMRCTGHTLEAPLPEGSRQGLGRREEGEGSHIRRTCTSLSLCPSIIHYWQCLLHFTLYWSETDVQWTSVHLLITGLSIARSVTCDIFENLCVARGKHVWGWIPSKWSSNHYILYICVTANPFSFSRRVRRRH